ncbi:MAG: DNA polymerase IV [Candidatus Hodarchaeota archaeon]
MDRFILHVDLDSFFASVEKRDNPEYKDKPVIVGADPKNGTGRGVVSTCSYEARKFGIHSAMPISQAYRRCPDGIYLRPNVSKYMEASRRVMDILKEFSSIFQQAGHDEAYLDISENCSTIDDSVQIADRIRDEVQEKIGITCSVGIAHGRYLAKIASDCNKPNGTTLITPDNVMDVIGDLDVTKIPGIGKKSKQYYNEKGFKKIRDFYGIVKPRLVYLLGDSGAWIYKLLHGLDKGIVNERHWRKSMSMERTFSRDSEFDSIVEKLKELNRKMHQQVEKRDIHYKTISIKIRFQDFKTFTRSRSFNHPIQDQEKAGKILMELVQEFEKDKRKVRLIGLKLSNLEFNSSKKQKTIFDY